MLEADKYISELIKKARAAQEIAETYDQKRVDRICETVAYACVNPKFMRKAADMLYEESEMGNPDDKFQKIRNKVLGVYSEMKDEKSVGIIKEDREKQLVTYIKPMGVIGGIIPVTNGESTIIVKTLWALKSRNALIVSPHRRGKNTAAYIVSYIRKILGLLGEPQDLIQNISPDQCGREAAAEMMKQCDFIVATGGNGLVKAAYSSGTPAIGVGAGNATVYIDESADLTDFAEKLKISQSFDNSSSCSSENNLICHSKIYENVIHAMENNKGFLIKEGSAEKERLIKTIWPNWPENDALGRRTPAKSAVDIAKMAGIEVPEDTVYLVIEEQKGYGRGVVTTGEKLCPVVSLLKADSFDTARNMIKQILLYQGEGHSCGIFTKNESQIEALAEKIHVCRILVNQPQSMGNAGAYFNGMPSTNSLGCGSWGGNSSSHNVTWRDLTNTTTVSRYIPEKKTLKEENVFSGEFRSSDMAKKIDTFC